MRNLELELTHRPTVRPVRPATLGVPWTPASQLAASLAVLLVLIGVAIALGYGSVAVLAAIASGLAWVARGRDGVAITALVALGSLPYLVLVVRLASGA